MSVAPPDIVGLVVTYLQGVMAGDLNVSATQPGIWAEYAPKVPLPYAIVTDSMGESYAFESNDPATGYYTVCIAEGMLGVSFIATTKAQAKLLARICARRCVDTQFEPISSDATTIELRPSHSVGEPLEDTGPSTSTIFKSTVTLHYRQTYPS